MSVVKVRRPSSSWLMVWNRKWKVVSHVKVRCSVARSGGCDIFCNFWAVSINKKWGYIFTCLSDNCVEESVRKLMAKGQYVWLQHTHANIHSERQSDCSNEVQLYLSHCFAVSQTFVYVSPLILSLSSYQITEAQLEPVLPGVTAGCQVTASSSYTQANYSSLGPPLPVC